MKELIYAFAVMPIENILKLTVFVGMAMGECTYFYCEVPAEDNEVEECRAYMHKKMHPIADIMFGGKK